MDAILVWCIVWTIFFNIVNHHPRMVIALFLVSLTCSRSQTFSTQNHDTRMALVKIHRNTMVVFSNVHSFDFIPCGSNCVQPKNYHVVNLVWWHRPSVAWVENLVSNFTDLRLMGHFLLINTKNFFNPINIDNYWAEWHFPIFLSWRLDEVFEKRCYEF